MWLPWRRKSAAGGVVGRHRVADPHDRNPVVTTPRAPVPQVSPLLATPAAAPSTIATSVAVTSKALPLEPVQSGNVGLVFRDGTEHLIAPGDPGGHALRDLAAQMTTRQLADR